MRLVNKKQEEGPTDILMGMAVDLETALEVSLDKAPSYRTIAARLSRDTDMRFETQKSGDKVLIWRVA